MTTPNTYFAQFYFANTYYVQDSRCSAWHTLIRINIKRCFEAVFKTHDYDGPQPLLEPSKKDLQPKQGAGRCFAEKKKTQPNDQ